MSDNLRDRIAKVFRQHDDFTGTCRCGWVPTSWETPTNGSPLPQDLHLADAVIEALGLEVECGGTYAVGGEATSHRYITEWETDE
jgi:hypothetical protein